MNKYARKHLSAKAWIALLVIGLLLTGISAVYAKSVINNNCIADPVIEVVTTCSKRSVNRGFPAAYIEGIAKDKHNFRAGQFIFDVVAWSLVVGVASKATRKKRK
jgi:hypothetical protein